MSGVMNQTDTGKTVAYSKVWNLPNILTYGRIVAVPVVAARKASQRSAGSAVSTVP